jgi:ABC-type uncharacterized transport system YnjBCD permease subunit
MARTIETTKQNEAPGRMFWLWVGMLLPPTAWAAQLQALYLTSEFGCFTSDFFWNHVVSVVALVLSIFGGFTAWREWKSAGSNTEDEGGNPLSRKRFMSMIGILTGSLFTAVIFAQWLPTLLGVPCDK